MSPASPTVRLEAMPENEYTAHVERSTANFAKSSPRYRDWNYDEAVADVRKDYFSKIMPQGFASPGHLLYLLYEGETRIGVLHLGETPVPGSKSLYAWDFEIFEPFRGRGLGKLAMKQAAILMKERGYTRVTLNVFGQNTVARGLYESMGFEVRSVQMSKEL
jgi:ribosomal protein S18 acetylase RimI-like enzyme